MEITINDYSGKSYTFKLSEIKYIKPGHDKTSNYSIGPTGYSGFLPSTYFPALIISYIDYNDLEKIRVSGDSFDTKNKKEHIINKSKCIEISGKYIADILNDLIEQINNKDNSENEDG